MSERPYGELVEPWVMTELETIAQTPIFTLRRRRCTCPEDDSRSGSFVYLDTSDWCNVIALTADDEIVMIEQFRHGLGAVTLELPGGVVDPGEGPAEACARELREETGYTGGPVQMLGSVSANPAMQNNHCHVGLIREACLTASTSFDPHEQIAVRLVPRSEIPALVSRGVIHHSLIVASLYHLSLQSD